MSSLWRPSTNDQPVSEEGLEVFIVPGDDLENEKSRRPLYESRLRSAIIGHLGLLGLLGAAGCEGAMAHGADIASNAPASHEEVAAEAATTKAELQVASEPAPQLAAMNADDFESAHDSSRHRAATVILYVDAAQGDDRRGHGRSAKHAYRSIARALAEIPSLVDAGYTIRLAAGRYREDVTFDRFVMPPGALRTLIFHSLMPSRYLILLGDPEHPENVVIEGAVHCINAVGVLLMVRGLSCAGSAEAGLYATASSVIVDDVLFTNTGGSILVENSTLNLGGVIRMTDNTTTAMAIRSNSFARDTTPWHAGVVIEIVGGKLIGIFIRDQSTLALQSASSQVTITDIGFSPERANTWALYVQSHAHAFGGRYFVSNVRTGFEAVWHSYINVDVEADQIAILASAIKFSAVSLERPGSLTAITVMVQADLMSIAAVGDVMVSSPPGTTPR